jgi:hypothetical protein
MVSPGGRVLIGTTTDNGTDDFQVIGTGSISGALKLSNSLNVAAGIFETSGRLEVGSTTAAASAYVDFHSSGSNNDYDARIISSGGTSGTAGAASLSFYGNGGFTFNTTGTSTFTTTGSLSALMIKAGSYQPIMRSNSGNSAIEFVNSANSAVNFTIADSGNIIARGKVNSTGDMTTSGWFYAGNGTGYFSGSGDCYGSAWGTNWLSTYLTNQLNAKMNLAGGTFTGVVNSNNEIAAPHLRVTSSYGTGGGAGLSAQGVALSWNDGNGDGAGYLAVNQGLGTGGWCLRTVNNTNSSEIGRYTISASGVGTNGSDKRLKKHIKTLKGSLEKIRQIRGVSYTYRASGEKHYGVIAQEIQPYFPDAVTATHDLKRHKDILGVAYNDLIAPLIEAVKELADQLDAARARITDLEAAFA